MGRKKSRRRWDEGFIVVLQPEINNKNETSMKHNILHSLHHLMILGVVVITVMLTGCNDKQKRFSFESAQEAVNTCHQELNKLLSMEKCDIEQLTQLTNNWLVLQDSTYSVMMRDSTMQKNDELASEFFTIADSIRTKLIQLALSERHTMKDVVTFKVATASGREDLMKSKEYQVAETFFKRMDQEPIYNNLGTALVAYDKLLTEAKPFKTEQQFYQFIQQEDKCFRSLLTHLSEVPQPRLQSITDQTSELFNTLYKNTMTSQDDETSDRVMLYLTMRFNRRIIQNAETCQNDIKAQKKLTDQQAANYRWMLIQPFMTIDNYATAAMTTQQIESLTKIAEELPILLAYIDGKDYDRTPKENTEKLSDILSEYFLKSHLKSIL